MCSGGDRMIDQTFERGNEIIRHRAADAAVGQFDDAILGAVLDAAALQNIAVDADVAEFVDDHGEAASAGVFKHVTNERRLAGAEEARDDRAGNFGKSFGMRCHCEAVSKSLVAERGSGGTRAIVFLRT